MPSALLIAAIPGPGRPRARWAGALVSLLLAALAGSGCGAAPPRESAAGDGAHTYRVRGVVVALPDARSGHAITLHHEAIPGFVDFTGKPSTMESMTMPFPLAAGVTADGLAVGDIVEATLIVDWSDPSRPARLTQMRRLPRDTVLDFGAAQSTGG